MKETNRQKAIQLRHELHAHPELSNHEIETKKRLKQWIRENTSLEIVDKDYYFYVVHRAGEGKKNIAFRTDMDALPIEETITPPYASTNPGVSHKCGHDGHMATMCGFALEVDQQKPDKNVFLLFQPAEETGDGAKVAQEMIDIEKIDEIFGYHNWSGHPRKSINIIDGTSQFASKGMSMIFEGTPSHASEPEMGRNPVFAIAEIVSKLNEFTSPQVNEGLVLATVVQVQVGSMAFGVNPGDGVLRMTIRAQYERELEALQKNLENLAREEAEKYELSVHFEYNDEFPETFNHKESSDKVRQVAKENGFELREMPIGFRASEDFGHYLKKTKGAMFYVGNGEDYPAIHTVEYDFVDELIPVVVDMYLGLMNL